MLDRRKYPVWSLCNRDPDNSVLAQHSGQDVFESNFRKPITRDVYFGEDTLLYRKKPRLPVFFEIFKRQVPRTLERCRSTGDRDRLPILRAGGDLRSNPWARWQAPFKQESIDV